MEYFPAGQFSHTDEIAAPVMLEDMPEEHKVHELDSEASWYAPAGQLEHACAPAVEYDPARQLAHTVEAIAPVVVEYIPAVHAIQALARPAGW